MSSYIIDEFAQEFFSEESVNVNCVLSWRTLPSNRGVGQTRLLIDNHNGWIYDSDWPDFRADAAQRLLTGLQHR